MLSFLCKNLLKVSGNGSLKSTSLCILNQTQRHFSENVQPQITEKRNDFIVSLFKTYGFTETQISNLLNKRPSFLSLTNKNLKPKFDFFRSYGFSPSDLYRILTVDPHVLGSSLKNRIIPCCEFLEGILKDNASVIASVKRSPHLLRQDLRKNVVPNIELLRICGMPDSRTLLIVRTQPRNLMLNKYRFKMLVEEVIEMGFNPVKRHFVEAIHVMTALNKSTRDRKWDLFRKWGFSEDEILWAFRRHPLLVSNSDEKIERVMGFLVNKMGLNASKVSSCPTILSHSLENWIKPRCLVIQFLLSKGVLKENLVLSSFIVLAEDRFKKRYVDKYCVEFPEVLNLYGRTEENTQRLHKVGNIKFKPHIHLGTWKHKVGYINVSTKQPVIG